MTYDQATIEKAARLLCEKWLETDAMFCRFAVETVAEGHRDKFRDDAEKDIEEALRRAVEES